MTTLATTLQVFFSDRLIRQRQVSPNTLQAYRDTLRLLLVFASERYSKVPAKLDIDDLDSPLIGAFLDHLERDRKNSVRTRNARLAAIRSLFRYAALRHPEHAATIERVLAIPPKRFERRLVTYLSEAEIKALLATPNRTTWTGRRDMALFGLAVQTGLRASELIGLRCSDVHLGSGAHVGCNGKGRKERVTPLTSNTVAPVSKDPASVILDRYRIFLTAERSLAMVTAARYIDCLRPFLSQRVLNGGLDLRNLRPADVTAFVVARCPQLNAGVAKLTVTALRSFLGFLHLDGVTERSLVHAAPKVLRRRLAGLPKGLEPDQVRRLLAACDVDTAVGCRDLAILTLLVRLGLRRGEVARLRLDDIDWRAGTISVHGKGNCYERVPLPPDVGHRVAEYLQHGRPTDAQGRTVFVRHFAPHHALSTARVSTIVADAARRAGLGRVHAHRLRHTAATELLRAGASLPEIGQLLRHRHTATTAIYAKVDRDNLRLIARPWPEGAL